MDLKVLEGKKTYIVAVATICYALGGMVAGYIEPSIGIPLILAALGISSLRNSVPVKEPIVIASEPVRT